MATSRTTVFIFDISRGSFEAKRNNLKGHLHRGSTVSVSFHFRHFTHLQIPIPNRKLKWNYSHLRNAWRNQSQKYIYFSKWMSVRSQQYQDRRDRRGLMNLTLAWNVAQSNTAHAHFTHNWLAGSRWSGTTQMCKYFFSFILNGKFRTSMSNEAHPRWHMQKLVLNQFSMLWTMVVFMNLSIRCVFSNNVSTLRS